MANKAKGFVVVAGQRPSGSAFWMVRGTLDRHQIRREFDNRPDALAFAELKNSELFGTKPKQAHLLTHLTPEQLHASEAVALQLKRDFPGVGILDLLDYYRDLSQTLSVVDAARISPAIGRLKKKYPDADLGFACDWFASNYQPPKSTLSLRIALEHYLADTQRRHSKHTLSTPQYNRIGYPGPRSTSLGIASNTSRLP